MQKFNRTRPADLERRELQLTLFASGAIIVLAVGLALFMFPVVFSNQPPFSHVEFSIAFFGFCILSILLAVDLIDRQLTIQRLRRQIIEDQRRGLAIQEQASSELFKALPGFNSFQDQLSMEFRRAATSGRELSLLVFTISLEEQVPLPGTENSMFGDAAKAILRKLRQQDSFYLLQQNCFGIILPDAVLSDAKQISSRLAEGLMDAAGVYKRFTFESAIVNYPNHAHCAQELENEVRKQLPHDQISVLEGHPRNARPVFAKSHS